MRKKAYVIDSLLGNEGKMAVRLTMQGAALGGMKRDDEAVAAYQKLFPRFEAWAISTPSASLSTKWVLSFLRQKAGAGGRGGFSRGIRHLLEDG